MNGDLRKVVLFMKLNYEVEWELDDEFINDLVDEVEEVKKVELVQDEVSLGYGDLLSRLQEEELALKELEEIKKNREKDKQINKFNY